jgi:hypothetical protein
MGAASPLRHESSDVKTNIMKIGAVSLAAGLCLLCSGLRAQVTTTTTAVANTDGAFTEFVPGSHTVVVSREGSPFRYSVTKQTTIVDETGAPVPIERISPGSPLSVQHTGPSDHLVASRIVVHNAPLAQRHTTTTTTTTRPLTHDEKEALEDQRDAEKEALEKRIERRKEAVEKASDAEKERLEKLKDKLDDGD